MNKHKRMLIATLPALALVVLGASVASAYGGPNLGFRNDEDLTEDQRAAIEEAQELRKEGDGAAAYNVLKGAGLDPYMRGHKMRALTEEERQVMSEKREAIRMAIKDGDFNAFKDATADMPFAHAVTEENFAKLVKAHGLLEDGDKEGALEIFKEIEMPMPHMGRGNMMHHLNFRERQR